MVSGKCTFCGENLTDVGQFHDLSSCTIYLLKENKSLKAQRDALKEILADLYKESSLDKSGALLGKVREYARYG